MPITTQSHKHQAIADKYVGQACTMRTLDGDKDAIICGRLQPFAVISTIPSGHTIQVNWPTVARKMESDKLFYACAEALITTLSQTYTSWRMQDERTN